MTSPAAGQVGGMEGSESLRMEFARESRGWVCRECGGTNVEVMRGVWAVCRRKGIEVDQELDAGFGDDAGVGVGSGGEVGEGSDETTEVHEQEEAQDSGRDTVVAERDISRPTETSAPATSASTAVAHEHPPRPTPTIPTSTRATPAPASSPWLDRAIIAVVMALLLVILRRVSGVHEL